MLFWNHAQACHSHEALNFGHVLATSVYWHSDVTRSTKLVEDLEATGAVQVDTARKDDAQPRVPHWPPLVSVMTALPG